ncbi:hypothetical protein [Streptomyces sp. TLI_105]|uniref:DUF6917 domain-containing protein n=1 Tax=Streptomyces sp. TLI_105 TaxID=1881019 RepID=UPI0008963F3F|nr:hypothetical protein [Streptomyces sp. TLI_105]SEC15247.1 hypothetical protein SAMN05428939_1690 [Streptomyces sp. TLI_105]
MPPTTSTLFSARSDVTAHWVAVMRHRRNDRALVPAPLRTRCLRAGEIHEFILCRPGTDRAEPMNEVSYLGFAEISRGGVLEVGDELYAGNRLVGTVHGFDEIHLPNHYNILVAVPELITGADAGLRPGEPLTMTAGADKKGHAL